MCVCVQLRNLDYARFATGGRGGVDDLIQLTHLHEPAILDVLVSYAVCYLTLDRFRCLCCRKHA